METHLNWDIIGEQRMNVNNPTTCNMLHFKLKSTHVNTEQSLGKFPSEMTMKIREFP